MGKENGDFLLAKLRDEFIGTYFPGNATSIKFHMAQIQSGATKRITYASFVSFYKSPLRGICVPRHQWPGGALHNPGTLEKHSQHISATTQYTWQCVFTRAALKVVPSVPQRNPGRGMDPPTGAASKERAWCIVSLNLTRLIQVGNTGSGSQMYEYLLDLMAQCQKMETSYDKRERGTREMPRDKCSSKVMKVMSYAHHMTRLRGLNLLLV